MQLIFTGIYDCRMDELFYKDLRVAGRAGFFTRI